MSVDKFSKHQRSNKPKYVLTGANGEVICKSDDVREFLTARSLYLTSVKAEHSSRTKIK